MNAERQFIRQRGNQAEGNAIHFVLLRSFGRAGFEHGQHAHRVTVPIGPATIHLAGLAQAIVAQLTVMRWSQVARAERPSKRSAPAAP